MTASLPSAGYISGPRSQGEYKQAMEDMRDVSDRLLRGAVSIDFTTDADITLTEDQYTNHTIELTDTGPVLTTGRNVILPTDTRIWIVQNSTAQTLTFKTSSGTGKAVLAGRAMLLRSDGTNIIGVSSQFGNSIVAYQGSVYSGMAVHRDDQHIAGKEDRATVDVGTGSGAARLVQTHDGVITGAILVHPDETIRFYGPIYEKCRISASGGWLIGKTSTGLGTVGLELSPQGLIWATVDGNSAIAVNRLTSDGVLQSFYQDSVLEGSISVAGTTVSYNSFLGSHWSQLSGDAITIIPIGTVLSTIDELCVWIAHEWTDANSVAHHDLYDGPLTVGETWEETETLEDGSTVQILHTVVQEQNTRLPRCTVSSQPYDRRVYGVFGGWDEDGDVIVHGVGLASGVRVTGPCSGGDILVSRGDGTAMVDNSVTNPAVIIGKVSIGRPDAGVDDVNIIPATLYCG